MTVPTEDHEPARGISRLQRRGLIELAFDVFALGGATFGVAFIKALTAALVARFYGYEAYGGFAAAWSLSQGVVAVAEIGMGEWSLLAFRAGATSGRAQRRLLQLALISLGAALLLGALSWILFDVAERSWSRFVVVLLVVNLAYAGQLVAQYVLRASHKVRWASAVRGVQVVVVSGLGAIVVLCGAELIVTLWTIAVAEVAVLSALVFLASRALAARGRDTDEDSSAPPSIAPFTFAAWSIFAYLSSDAVILAVARSADEVGDYTAAYRLYTLVLQVAGLLMGSVAPHLYGARSADERERVFVAVRGIQQTLSIGLAAIVCAGAGIMVRAYVGAGFGRAEVVLSVLSVSVLVKGLTQLPLHALVSTGRQAVRARVLMVAAVLNVGLNLYLIPRYGLWAALGTTIVTDLFILAGLMLAARRGPLVPLSRPRAAELLAVLSLVGCAMAAPVGIALPAWALAIPLAGALWLAWSRRDDLRSIGVVFGSLRSQQL